MTCWVSLHTTRSGRRSVEAAVEGKSYVDSGKPAMIWYCGGHRLWRPSTITRRTLLCRWLYRRSSRATWQWLRTCSNVCRWLQSLHRLERPASLLHRDKLALWGESVLGRVECKLHALGRELLDHLRPQTCCIIVNEMVQLALCGQ